MPDRGLQWKPPRDDDSPPDLPAPSAAQFPRIRKALCRVLDQGRHWPARNVIAACGSWRELEALIGRDLPTHDTQILQVHREQDGSGFSILSLDPVEKLLGTESPRILARLVEGTDY